MFRLEKYTAIYFWVLESFLWAVYFSTMSAQRRRVVGWGLVLLLIVLNVWICILVLQPSTSHELSVSFLNVGQGDSIFIQGPTGIQVLVDGGPDKSAVRELPRLMGPLDRSINLIVETHPDKDHISGLADVLEQYSVDAFMSPGAQNDTNVFGRLMSDVENEPGIVTYTARAGMRIDLGDGAYADVLYPDTDVSHIKVTNDASIVLHVVYGDTSFMLTGDLPSTLEDQLVHTLATQELKSTILKAGHHGSKYSTDALWLRAVAPETVVISAGKGNTYGHPSPEALARIQTQGSEIVSTMESGTITYVSDGTSVVRK